MTTCNYPSTKTITDTNTLISTRTNAIKANPTRYDTAMVALFNTTSTNWNTNLTTWATTCSGVCNTMYSTCEHNVSYLCAGDASSSSYPATNKSQFDKTSQTCQCSTGKAVNGKYCSSTDCTPACSIFSSGGYACVSKAGGDSGKGYVTYTKQCP